MEIMSIVAWGLGALGASGLGYFGWAYSNRYYLRGRRKAYGFVTGPIRPPKSLFENWVTELPKFKNQVLETALKTDTVEIQEQIDKYKGEADLAKTQIKELEERKSNLLSTTSEGDTQVDDSFYLQSEARITKELEEIDQQISELKGPLAEVVERKIEGSSEKVEAKKARTDAWYRAMAGSLKTASQDLSQNGLALGMLVFDWVLAVTFFEDLAKTVREPWWLHFAMAYILPLVITLLAMWLMHITAHSVRTAFKNGLARINSLDLVGASLAGMGLLFILGLVLALRLQVAHTFIDFITEILFWALFVTFVIVVGYEGSKPEKNRSVNDFAKIPVMLIINLIGLVVLLPLWVVERLWLGIVSIFSGLVVPVSEKAKELQRRMNQLEQDKKAKQEELGKLRQERDAFKRGEISRAQQEKEARLQGEIKGIEGRIEELKKDLTKFQAQEQDWQGRLGNLTKGCNDGVDAGLSARKSQAVA